LNLTLLETLLPLKTKDFIEIYLTLNDASCRYSTRKKAESVDISPEIKDIILTITDIVAMSPLIEFIRIILKRLNSEQKLIISLPRDNIFDDIEKWFNDNRLQVKFR